MKKRLLLSFTLLCISSNFAQITNAFRVNYDQALMDLPANAIEGLTPYTYVFAGTNLNFLPIFGTVTQVDATGNLVWSKRYSDASIGFQLNDIKKDVANNQYFACGGSEANDAVFVKIDASGNLVVSKKFGITQADGAYFNRVIKTSDGGYVAVGYVTGYDPDGAGPEIDFVPVNYTDANGDPQTEIVGSPLIVKLNSSGDHVWHKVFRYYNNASKAPGTSIYNDASFKDVVETADGYIAVGSYDVNAVLSNTNSDGDDATANDALVLKTDFSGAITYHLQYDALNFSATQQSKYLTCINKTSTGAAIAAGSDNGREWDIKFNGTGGFSSTFSRLFTYSTFFGTPDPVEISNIYEIPGGTGDLATMGMYIKPLSFVFSNSVHRINAAATANVYAKYYTFSMATILPQGSLTADNSFIMASTVMGAGSFDYHIIKTDPNGDTPLSTCAPTTFTPSASAGTTTTATPNYNFFSGTVEPQALTVVATAISPTSSVQCSYIACTPPTAPVASVVTQPDCTTPTGSIQLTGLPTSGTWTVTGTPSGTATGNTSSTTISGLAPGNYTFTVDLGGCPSLPSNQVTINVAPSTPSAPIIGTITQPTCTITTGTIDLSGLPASGTWTVTGTPSGTATGTGTTTSVSGLAPGNYTFTVTDANGCISTASTSATVNPAPTTPTAPIIGTITQPSCATTTGTVDLSGLPASGTWTITGTPSGTATGTGTTTSVSGLAPGNYTFTVDQAGCTSPASSNVTINPAPTTPTAPIIGTITQPTCALATGTVDLSGLPASGTWTVTGTPSGTATGTGTTTSISGLAPGNYTFTVDQAGCTSPASSSVTINPAPGAPATATIGTITQPTCATPTGSFQITNPIGAQYTYSVDGINFQASTTISGLAPGNYFITVLDNGSGCSTITSTAITIDPVAGAPVIALVNSSNVTCYQATDGNIEINVSGGQAPYTYSWNPNIGNSGIVSNLVAGSYTVTVTDNLGCSSNQTFTITEPAELLVNGIANNIICGTSDGSITCNVSGGTSAYQYLWTPNGETTSSITNLLPGNYAVTVTDANGCTANQNFVITSTGTLPIDVAPGYSEINPGSSVVLTATGGTNYTWTPTTGLSCTNCPNPTAAPDVTTTYYVTSTEANGCTGSDSAIVKIKLPCGELFVPTIFSPNDNGPAANNALCVFGTPECIEEFLFQVYDRWGEKVFETEDITKCWDGNYKGKPMNSGIFVYRLQAKVSNQTEKINVSGNTTLVR